MKTITLRLSRDAEKLIADLDISPADAFARGLWLLNQAKQKRIALLRVPTAVRLPGAGQVEESPPNQHEIEAILTQKAPSTKSDLEAS